MSGRLLRTLSIALIFLLASCRPQPDFSSQYEYDRTWESLFNGFWNEMNKNYVFWDLDSPDDEWDRVYEEYAPKFADLEGLVGENDASSILAYSYLFDISKNLSDGHFAYRLKLGDNNYLAYSNYQYRLLKEAGYDDREILTYFLGNNPELIENTDGTENALSILESSFGAIIPSGQDVYFGPVQVSRYLEDCNVFYLADQDEIYSLFVLGLSEDNILYISMMSFDMYLNLTDSNSDIRNAAKSFIDLWKGTIQEYLSGTGEEIKGLIVDLRGNTGGYNADISILWNCLIAEDIYVADYTQKDGMNRLDFGPKVRYMVYPDESTARNFDKPIAVITNKATVSNGEITALFFKALGEYYGFETASFGGITSGGFGTAHLDNNRDTISPWEDPWVFNAGQFSIEDDLYVSTQARPATYRNGESYEGIGITPDFEVERNGGSVDNRLETAINWIEGMV